MTRDLLAIGHTALDYIITIDNFPKINSSVPITNMKHLHGGAAANVSVVASKMGLKTSLISAVGGEFKNSPYYNEFKKNDIDIDSMIVIEEESTPTAFVLTDKNNDQTSYFYWGAGKYFKDAEIPEKAIEDNKMIHLATGDPDFNWKCSIESKKQDKLVSFDPGQDLCMYSDKILKDVIENTSILFGNHHEIERITKILNKDINELIELGPEIIVKSCGEQGSIIYTNDNKIEVDAILKPSIDPTGAGDSYRASFLTRYINGYELEECARFASSVSSFVVEKLGCQTNIPSFDEAIARMEDFY